LPASTPIALPTVRTASKGLLRARGETYWIMACDGERRPPARQPTHIRPTAPVRSGSAWDPRWPMVAVAGPEWMITENG